MHSLTLILSLGQVNKSLNFMLSFDTFIKKKKKNIKHRTSLTSFWAKNCFLISHQDSEHIGFKQVFIYLHE